MQGLPVFDPKTRTVVDLESFIPQDHLLRQIERIVEPAFIRKLTTACYADGMGRPSIDPAVFHEIVKLCRQQGLVGETCCVMTDATLAQKRGTPRQLKYKVHQSIDADSRVILDTHVTTGARHDSQPYLQQLKRIEQRCRLTIVEATADRGYGSAAIIRTLQQQGKRTFIPLWSGRVGNSKHLKSGLVYEREQDRFRCPEGKYLTPNPALYENDKRYVSSSEDCQVCSQVSACTAKRKKSSRHQRFVLRSLDQDLFEEVQARMRDPVFRQKLSERMCKSEGLFAEAKQNHGLSRARYRGRAKVQIQAYLSAAALNLKRLVAALCFWLLARWSRRRMTTTHSPHILRKPTFSTRPVVFRDTPSLRTVCGQ